MGDVCPAFGLDDLLANPAFAKNNDRTMARDAFIPRLRDILAKMTRAEIIPVLEKIGLPFAPIARPEDLFDDPHLTASGSLLDITLPNGTKTRLPALPLEIDGQRLPLRRDLPAPGADNTDLK